MTTAKQFSTDTNYLLREIANDRQALTFTIEIDGELQDVTMTGRSDYTGRSRKSVIFVDVANETVAENLMNRRNRPTKLYREIVSKVFAELGEDIKMSWDQKAGCSMCACSPGFWILSNDIRCHYFWITVQKSDAVLNNGYITPLDAYQPLVAEMVGAN